MVTMALVNHSLYNDIEATVRQSKQDQFYLLDVDVTLDGVLMDKSTTFVKNITVESNYVEYYGDDIKCELMIPEGIFLEKLITGDDNILVTIKLTPTDRKNNRVDTSRKIIIYRYRGILNQKIMAGMIGGNPANRSFSAASISKLVPVHLQLVDLALESMLGIFIGTAVIDNTVENALKTLLGFGSKSRKVKEFSDTNFLGCDIYPPNNQKVYSSIIVDNRTPLHSLAHYLQNTVGVYSAGISQFFTGGMWYVYPTYHTDRYHDTVGSLTIIDMPPNKMPHTETSFITNEKETVILGTGKTINNSPTTDRLYNIGSGVRFIDGSNLLEGGVQFDKGYVTTDRYETVTEFLHDDRYGNRAIAGVAKNMVTTNPYKEYSRVAPTVTEQVDLEWHNSQLGVVYPGMPVRILYQRDRKTIVRYGTVGKCLTYIAPSTNSAVDRKYSTNSILSIILSSKIEER